MATATALRGFNDLGHSVTPAFLFSNVYTVQKWTKTELCNLKKNQDFYPRDIESRFWIFSEMKTLERVRFCKRLLYVKEELLKRMIATSKIPLLLSYIGPIVYWLIFSFKHQATPLGIKPDTKQNYVMLGHVISHVCVYGKRKENGTTQSKKITRSCLTIYLNWKSIGRRHERTEEGRISILSSLSGRRSIYQYSNMQYNVFLSSSYCGMHVLFVNKIE